MCCGSFSLKFKDVDIIGDRSSKRKLPSLWQWKEKGDRCRG